jgi:hypothetical protein
MADTHISCLICKDGIKWMSSATLEVALFQHMLWMHEVLI